MGSKFDDPEDDVFTIEVKGLYLPTGMWVWERPWAKLLSWMSEDD